MQVGFCEKDKQVVAAAAESTGGSIAEMRRYDKIADKMGLDDVDITSLDASEEIENFEMEKEEITLVVSMIQRNKTWTFSNRKRVIALEERLKKLVT